MRQPRRTRSQSAMVSSLVVVSGPHLGEVFDIGIECAIIGRFPGLGISLPEDDLVSRQHARIVMKEGGCQIRDLLSENGTYVNGLRITTSVPLRHGDSIRVGSVVLEFRHQRP